MTTVEEPPKADEPRTRHVALRAPRLKPAELTTSRYESVSSMLVALLITLGASVGVLVVVWLTSRIFVGQTAVPVQIVEMEKGIGGPPSHEEGLEWSDDSHESLDVERTLSAVGDAARENWKDGSAQSHEGDGRGTGDSKKTTRRRTSPSWDITFLEGNTLELYGQQLDYFHIELGAIGADSGDIVYVSGFSRSSIQTHSAQRSSEKRLYMSWRPGSPLRDADLKLMAKAGIDPKNPQRFVVQFYPDELVGRLQQLELEFRGRKRSQIERTRFGVQPKTNGGYEFFVLEQIEATRTVSKSQAAR